ncbi:hypothetical protein BH11GEM1_BH11GEM1_29590 [soil metagenome]
MRATQAKYREAEFFLGKLDGAYYEDVRRMFKRSKKPPVSQYYLSAFLSAARSVTWIMRSEYGKLAGWDEWYRGQKADENAHLLALFNQLRIQSEKIEPVVPSRAVRIEGDGGPPVVRDPRMPRFNMTMTWADPDSDGVPIMSGEVIEWKWTIDELDGDDLVATCRRYLGLLSVLVADCKASFPPVPLTRL